MYISFLTEKIPIFPLFETKSLDKIKSKQLTLKRELEAIGYKMILSSNEALIQGGMKEKDVDINIAVDIIHSCLEHSLEKIILCTPVCNTDVPYGCIAT